MTASLNIANIRRRWGMNQEAFAGLLDATRTQVSNWERGQTPPSTAVLLRLQAMTGIDVNRMHGEELTQESIPPAPIVPGDLPPAEPPILQEIRRLHSRLDDLEGMLRRLLAANGL